MVGKEASLLALVFGHLKCTSFLTGCDKDFDKYGGILLWFAIMLYMFKALGVICDEYFVPSLEVIVEKLQVSNDVAGATFMAAGSSAPELFTSLVATFLIVNAGGVGTIVGSAIFNIVVMIGIIAFVACGEDELVIWWYPLCRDTMFYLLSIIELVIFLSDEEIKVWEGLIMFATYLMYCFYMKYNPYIMRVFGIVAPGDDRVEEFPTGCADDKCEDGQSASEDANAQSQNKTGDTGSTAVLPSQPMGRVSVSSDPSNGSTYRSSASGLNSIPTAATGKPAQWSYRQSVSMMSVADVEEKTVVERRFRVRDPMVVFWEKAMPSPENRHGFPLFCLSILWIGICTYAMVDAANRIGIIMTVPPFVMGLIFLAAGTSIPDTLASIAVARQGEGDMAIANALGSNVFDILVGLGLPWTLRCMSGYKVTFPGQFDDFKYDIVILVAALGLFIVSLIVNKWRLNKKMGGFLIGLYVVFVVYQLLAVFAFGWKQVDDRRLLPVGIR